MVKIIKNIRRIIASLVMALCLFALVILSFSRHDFENKWGWICVYAFAYFLVEHFGGIVPQYDSKTSLSFSDIVIVASIFIFDPLSTLLVATIGIAIEDRFRKVSLLYSYLNIVTVGLSTSCAAIIVSSPIEANSISCILLALLALVAISIADSFTFALFGEYKEVTSIWNSRFDYLTRVAAIIFGIPIGIFAVILPWAVFFPISAYIVTLIIFRRNEKLSIQNANLDTLVDTLDFSLEGLHIEEIDQCLLSMARRITNTDNVNIIYKEPEKNILSAKFGSQAVGYRWFTISDIETKEKKWRHSGYIKSLNVVATIANRTFENYTLRLQLKNAAERDPLTGLYNRRTLEDILDHEMAQYRRGKINVCLLYMDLDRFKPVNDNYGHLIGDHILQIVSNQIFTTIREEDIAARIGGDEFIVLCRNTSEEDAFILANRIKAKVEKPIPLKQFNKDYTDINVGISIGISSASEQYNTSSSILNSADKNMFNEKKVKN